MTEEYRCRPGELTRLINKHLGKVRGRLVKALDKTAKDGVETVRLRAPKAFGDLRSSVHLVPGDNPRVVVDAPHAGAVEKGSAPHRPDFEKLVAWVKLRGMQGLTRIRSARLHGPTTREAALRVKDLLRAEVVKGPGGRFSPVDAPERVALAIAKGIETHGTAPHWFVRDSLPTIAMRLGRHIRSALRK